jgi:selenocysteine-specific elongation factor
MLIATAGHIDHGKTALVRALTGVETDRLPEEKKRGISIDLGFAYWPNGAQDIGFVDVPGHERFVRNMLAGVAAIDFALLVVAADDGVMPQTREHLQILDLLGIARGVVAITKCDRADPVRIRQTHEQVAGLLDSTSLAGIPIHHVSALTGLGMDALSIHIRSVASADELRAESGRGFRLAIDRVFSVTGAGTVATGTVQDGLVRVGDSLVATPSGRPVRVRGLQSGGRSVERAQPGQRCAVNLSGVDVGDLVRGEWLLCPGMCAPTRRIEVRLRALPVEGSALRHNSTLHLHVGTGSVSARLLIQGQTEIAPGAEGLAQLLPERPILAVTGDRFIVRDSAARRTVGGGRILDPFVPGRVREPIGRRQVLDALGRFDPFQTLSALLAIPDHEVDTARFERSFNLLTDTASSLYRQAGAVLVGRSRGLAIPAARRDRIAEAITECIEQFHREQPEEPGITTRELKDRVAPALSVEAFLSIQRSLVEAHRVESSGHRLRRPGHVRGIRAADRALLERLMPLLREGGLQPLTAEQLAQSLRASEPAVNTLLYRLREDGEVWRIAERRFLPRGEVARLAATAALLAEQSGGSGFSAAQYRDAIGTGRTLAIQILEFFDGIGVTRRSGDLRRMQPDYLLIVGVAEPFLAKEKPNNPAQPPKKVKAPPGRTHRADRRTA